MQQAKTKDDVPITYLNLKAPVEFFERIDRWRERYKREHEMVMAPSRPAFIRWCVNNFLEWEEQRQERRAKRKRSR